MDRNSFMSISEVGGGLMPVMHSPRECRRPELTTDCSSLPDPQSVVASESLEPQSDQIHSVSRQQKPPARFIICPYGPPIELRPDGRPKRFHAKKDTVSMLEEIFLENNKPNAKERLDICKKRTLADY
ncbi:hypothetical protein HDU84_005819 [Entophlyctis sp. JEL0112]|nr:hypothetical protein HDU84_005819 [Entophlyctis sp. JEL0112]